jgi:hypothetical protein
MYTPAKYFRGLSKTKKAQRIREIKRFGQMDFRDPAAYVGFASDKGVKTRESKYTRRFRRQFPGAHSLEARAAITGVPLEILQTSYNRGLAAWRTGHRPGATQQQWGYARVNSLLTCGKTHWTADSDLVRKSPKLASMCSQTAFEHSQKRSSGKATRRSGHQK